MVNIPVTSDNTGKSEASFDFSGIVEAIKHFFSKIFSIFSGLDGIDFGGVDVDLESIC